MADEPGHAASAATTTTTRPSRRKILILKLPCEGQILTTSLHRRYFAGKGYELGQNGLLWNLVGVVYRHRD
jgi:hypothetical protein